MRESLRARLLLWHISILALTMAAFGSLVCYLFWRSLVDDLDRTLRSEAEAIARALHPAASGTFDLELPPDVARDFLPDAGGGRYYAIWNAEGGLVDSSNPDMDLTAVEAPLERSRAGMREVAVRAAGDATVVVGQQTTGLSAALWSLAVLIAGVGAAALGVALAGGFALARRALAPIARISQTATAMAGGDFAARIATDRTDTELGQVANALNSAFDRLHLALEQQRRFTADASHELRTPLSILAAEVEWARLRPRSVDEYRESLDTCQRAATRMRGVVEGLLTLARADAGELALRAGPVALLDVVQDVTALLAPFAARHNVHLRTAGGDDVLVRGDPDRLREVLTNLVSNAIQYNRPDGSVDVRVWREDGWGCLQVEDTGIGIASQDVERVFERFFRADPARTREVGGAGIGLAITKWIVEAHKGQIVCSSEPGRGTRFVVRLPAIGTGS
jgi:signal transduction histidine kinase